MTLEERSQACDGTPFMPPEGQACPEGMRWSHAQQRPVQSKPAPTPPEPKRRGRPRSADEPLGQVTVHLPTPTQDRIIRLSSQRKQSVSEYLRDVMVQIYGGRS